MKASDNTMNIVPYGNHVEQTRLNGVSDISLLGRRENCKKTYKRDQPPVMHKLQSKENTAQGQNRTTNILDGPGI